jgi:hypothetical protein
LLSGAHIGLLWGACVWRKAGSRTSGRKVVEIRNFRKRGLFRPVSGWSASRWHGMYTTRIHGNKCTAMVVRLCRLYGMSIYPAGGAIVTVTEVGRGAVARTRWRGFPAKRMNRSRDGSCRSHAMARLSSKEKEQRLGGELSHSRDGEAFEQRERLRTLG